MTDVESADAHAGALTITPLSPALGAEITGISLAESLDDSAFARIQQAFADHLVLTAPGQHLDPGRLRALIARFGTLDVNPVAPKELGFEDVVRLEYRGNAPDIWHFDASWLPEPPMLGAISMVTCPTIGGDTMWLNGYFAYEMLSDPMRELLDPLTLVCDGAGIGRPELRAEHPIVRTHPVTGRKSLFVDFVYGTHVLELDRRESNAVMTFLEHFVEDPRFCMRKHWEPGDFVVWDNRCTLHKVVVDWTGERVAHRVSAKGTAPEGSPRRWAPYVGHASMAGRRNSA
jgi:taurine dioxygenase